MMALPDHPSRLLNEPPSRRVLFGVFGLSLAALAAGTSKTDAQAGAAQSGDKPPAGDKSEADKKTMPEKKMPTPEEKMAMRFPQPVRVPYLVGLPMLDENNATLGHVQSVVRSHEGKIKLVVDYGGLFGFGSRLVAVPIEVCVMLGRQVAAFDMPRAEFDVAPTWYGSGATALGPDETIQVAIERR